MNDYLKGMLIGASVGIIVMNEYHKMTRPRGFWQKVLSVFK